jgi:hypothetical protein
VIFAVLAVCMDTNDKLHNTLYLGTKCVPNFRRYSLFSVRAKQLPGIIDGGVPSDQRTDTAVAIYSRQFIKE